MAALIYLDTHVVVWLYAGRVEQIPERARNAIRENELLISPMVLLELQYLHEIGRVSELPGAVIEALEEELGLRMCEVPFSQVARRALEQSFTRDPFDRLIVSQAALRGLPLVTKDRMIHENYSESIWD